MAKQIQFEYPYDESPDVVADLMSRCQLYDFFNFDCKMFVNNFSLVHLNINRAEHKLDNLSSWLASLPCVPNVICLTETWFRTTSPPAVLPNYSVHSVPRATGEGGGICIFVQNDVNFSVLNLQHNAFITFEYAAITISTVGRPTMLIAIYRPPSTSIKDFLTELASLLCCLDKYSKDFDLCLVGDFNINLLANNCPDFTNLLLSYSLYPTIFHPTHIRGNSKSLIDNFFTNCCQSWHSGVLNCDLSDHEMIFLSIDKRVMQSNPSNSVRKFLSTKKLVKFVSSVNFDFIDNTSCVHEDCRHLAEVLIRGVEYSMTQSEVKDNFKCPWITAGIINSTKHKHKIYKKYLKGEVSYEVYKAYRNKLTNIIRLSKQNYFLYFCQKNKANAKVI